MTLHPYNPPKRHDCRKELPNADHAYGTTMLRCDVCGTVWERYKFDGKPWDNQPDDPTHGWRYHSTKKSRKPIIDLSAATEEYL